MARRPHGNRGRRYGQDEDLGDVSSQADQPAAQPAGFAAAASSPRRYLRTRSAETCRRTRLSRIWRSGNRRRAPRRIRAVEMQPDLPSSRDGHFGQGGGAPAWPDCRGGPRQLTCRCWQARSRKRSPGGRRRTGPRTAKQSSRVLVRDDSLATGALAGVRRPGRLDSRERDHADLVGGVIALDGEGWRRSGNPGDRFARKESRHRGRCRCCSWSEAATRTRSPV